jgi:hypothetical protein
MPLVRIERNPTTRQLLVFGAAWLSLLGVAGLMSWMRGRHNAAEALWVLAAGLPLAALIDRRVPRLAYVGLSYATYPVGFALSYVVLAVVFYLVLTPIGLAMRLFGYDPLARKFDPRAQSYWIARDTKRTMESYFNQG